MRLSDWAKENGVTYRTARRYFDDGKIPGAYRLSERIIIVPDDHTPDTSSDGVRHVTIYSRVSGHDQKDDLKRQSDRLREFAMSNGWVVDKTVEEIASGMDPRRKKLTTLLTDAKVGTILVENRDRLARMNADLIIAATPKDIVVAVEEEPESNDVQDIIDFMTSVFARKYGCRSAKNRAEREAKRLCEEAPND